MQTITERPARVAGEISRQLAAQERKAARARLRVRKLRERASAEIERLIAFLDETDGYSMDEREPWLGAAEIAPSFSYYSEKYQMWFTRDGDQSRWAGGVRDDREQDEGDDEPSLGSSNAYVPADQSGWAAVGRGDDREADYGNGQTTDDEDSLGWTTTGAHGLSSDLEDEHDGCEPSEDTELDDADKEPSLGWPEASGCGGAGWGLTHDGEQGDCKSDVIAAQHRGRSNSPGVSINSHGYGVQITGLTARQKEMLGTVWVRR
jgi:hypothetical protein